MLGITKLISLDAIPNPGGSAEMPISQVRTGIGCSGSSGDRSAQACLLHRQPCAFSGLSFLLLIVPGQP